MADAEPLLELRAEDVLGRDDAVERRLDDFPRRRGDDEEGETVAVDAAIEEIDERRDAAAQAHAPARLLEVLATHAAKLRIVTNQVGELRSEEHTSELQSP